MNAYARDLRDERALIVGDFNTGLPIDAEGTPFVYSEKMAELLDIGWIDAWRQRNPEGKEYTWYSNANKGFRLDYAFASPKMNGIGEGGLSLSSGEGGRAFGPFDAGGDVGMR